MTAARGALPTLACVAAALTALLPSPGEAHPRRRAGLWEVRVAGSDAIGMAPTRFCVGEQTDTARSHL
ncbi:MAG: hypothetical protein ACK50I_07545, partial [Burkholderiales bacterium]